MSATIDLTSPSPQKKTKKRDLLDYYSLGKRKNTNNDNNDNAGNGKKKKNLPKSGDILSVKAYLNVPFSEKDEVCLHICNAFSTYLLIFAHPQFRFLFLLTDFLTGERAWGVLGCKAEAVVRSSKQRSASICTLESGA